MNYRNYKYFLTTAAFCSFLGALTTALLIFLPNPIAQDFESKALLYQNKLYLTKLWILFLHPQVNIIASLGVGVLLFKKHPLYIIIGTLFLLIWAYTEMQQQAFLIDALNQFWRPGYLNAEGETSKNVFITLIKAATGISDSKYFLVIYGFGIGSLMYGLALVKQHGLGKWIGVSLIFIGLLSLFSFVRYYLGINSIGTTIDWIYKWIYSYLQPLVRIALGIWLIRELRTKIE